MTKDKTPIMSDKYEAYSNDIGDAFLTEGCTSTGSRLTARMPTVRHAAEYNMKHKNRGVALIFNHETFDIQSLMPRSGTEADSKNLSSALKKLKFDVRVYKDKKLREIQVIVDEESRANHTDNDCILVAILSHGDHGYIYAKDVQYKLESILQCFNAKNCPTLAGKPKLFFVQACQGDGLDAGITLERTETDGESTMSYRIPIHADFLIAYSTIPGFFSWRNTTKGSWFMQSLCQELNENGRNYDILTLLTFVCQRVAMDFESSTPNNPAMHQQKQIPCTTTMLTRLLRFADKP